MRVVYCIGHLGDQIRDYVGDGRRFELHADYVDEGSDLLGTAGAIRLAYDTVQLDDRFVVIYGDSLPDVDLGRVVRTAEATGLPALMTVFHNHGELDQSNADFDGLLVTYNKHEPDPSMEWIDYGVSVLTKELVRTISAGAFIDLADVFGEVSLRRQLAGYPADRRFHEVGTPHSRDELVRILDQQRKAT